MLIRLRTDHNARLLTVSIWHELRHLRQMRRTNDSPNCALVINTRADNPRDPKEEIPVRTSTLNRIPVQDEVLILGGGVAGCAASIALARKGRGVTLIEREPTPRHKVCGEFLSGEALEDLHALGIDVASLGAVPIDYVRLAAARRAAEAPLPFPAASLTRKALDTALIAEAIAAGVRVERGRSVQALGRTASNIWQATLDDGTTYEAPTVFLATGKHDLRGHTRPKDPRAMGRLQDVFSPGARAGR